MSLIFFLCIYYLFYAISSSLPLSWNHSASSNLLNKQSKVGHSKCVGPQGAVSEGPPALFQALLSASWNTYFYRRGPTFAFGTGLPKLLSHVRSNDTLLWSHVSRGEQEFVLYSSTRHRPPKLHPLVFTFSTTTISQVPTVFSWDCRNN